MPSPQKIILTLLLLVASLNAQYIKDLPREIVVDTKSGLIWQDNEDVKTLKKTWTEAISYCESLTLGTYNDWRLPNYNELYMLVDSSLYNPALNSVFENVNTHYWSSTTYASLPERAWTVDFKKGSDSSLSKTDLHYLRCVR